MRPDILNPLFAEVRTIKGVGDASARNLARLFDRPDGASARLVDALFHLPAHVIDRRYRCTISQLPVQGMVTVEVTVGDYKSPARGLRHPHKVTVFDNTGEMTLVFFSSYGDQMARMFPKGEQRIVSGEISWFGAKPQINHPDYVLPVAEAEKLPLLEPVYPLSAGVTNKLMRRVAGVALERLPALGEWQDASWLRQQSSPGFTESLQREHVPADATLRTPERQTLARLAYDELLANQLALNLVRSYMKRKNGRTLIGNGLIAGQLQTALPYKLTAAQQKAVAEIKSDMARPSRMLRLLQGDVGAGKTVVALMALATAVEAGTQGALMVPTEILARQHFASFSRLVSSTSLRMAILTGREKGRAREEVLARLAEGKIDILIGTHALIQDGIVFHDLGLAVIDEQHRFGVHQRLSLQGKGQVGVDLLVMTATPIPRTLALTVYGDMDISVLNEKPPGRVPIDTRVLPESRLEDVIAGLGRSLATGARAYWVCPLVEESEQVDLANAEARFAALDQAFPGKVGLLHGRMKGPTKDEVMAKFKSGALSILVATTVIEVGVDVPEATIMVIENAERFGLAQLHQLRGRVGRGKGKSTCLLIYSEPLGVTAKQRLSVMRETEDGFLIAEEDLKLRGAGEVLGTRQSGQQEFKFANLSVHYKLLAAARDDAALILSRDPKLQSERGQALLNLLYLFGRDEAIKLLSAG